MAKWILLAAWIIGGGVLAAAANNKSREECGRGISLAVGVSIYAFWPQFVVSSWFHRPASGDPDICTLASEAHQ